MVFIVCNTFEIFSSLEFINPFLNPLDELYHVLQSRKKLSRKFLFWRCEVFGF